MTRAQGIGSLAAIGGLTAMIALQTGLPSARADELQDLIANQQLLQQRIDQLAKAQKNEQQAAVLGGPVVAGAPSIAGSFPRSFLIPGTNTSIAISGYIKFDAAEWFHGGSVGLGAGVGPSVTGIPAVAALPLNLKGPGGTIFATPAYNNAARSNFVFHDSAAESRLRVETRTPTDYGQVGTVLEFDFYGCTANANDCNNLDGGTFGQLPRLRLAYATLGGFFAGQGFIPVNDLDAGPETLDFGGDAGRFGFARAPWIGYTWQLPYGTSFQLAAVTPETSFYGPIGATNDDAVVPQLAGTYDPTGAGGQNYAIDPNKTTIPDINLVLRNNQPWGHVQLGLVGQRLNLNDGAFLNQAFFGYGGGISGSVKPNWFGFPKDNFGFDFYMGPSLGHYANPSGSGEPTTVNALATNWGMVGVACNPLTGVGCYGNADGTSASVTAANAKLVRTSTVLQYGAEANYQHWWASNLRSTVSAGFQTQEIPTSLVATIPHGIPGTYFDNLPVNGNALQYNRTLITAHANILWSPVSFIDTGFEFVWGHRLTLLGATASEDVVDYAFKVKF
jgi:Porin subfamily